MITGRNLVSFSTESTKLRHPRLRLFQYYLRPYQIRARQMRSQWFRSALGIKPNMRVIDLGGTPAIWNFVDVPLDITILNLVHAPTAQSEAEAIRHHKFSFITGDACNTDLPSNGFDVVFCNSVIEHVGNKDRRSALAANVRRLARKHWVQTPAKYFPIEAHTGMPFWWYYPESLRQSFIRRWQEQLPLWTEMVEGTTLVELVELQQLFPEAAIYPERHFGIVKSYVCIGS